MRDVPTLELFLFGRLATSGALAAAFAATGRSCRAAPLRRCAADGVASENRARWDVRVFAS